MKKYITVLFTGFLLTSQVYATPSTLIWNPSTDIQPYKLWHLGVDTYMGDKRTISYVGFTYGAYKNCEVGFDVTGTTQYPLLFNAKYGLPEKKNIPACAVGVFNMGTKHDVTDYNMVYALVAKTFPPVGRFTAGGYVGGNENLFLDENGKKENTGVMLAWDKTLSKKWWASIDYASGNNWYGSLSGGVAYTFAENVSVIFGYVKYNNHTLNTDDSFTTQVDINF